MLFRNGDGTLGCLTDLCPHRAARLSDEQVIDGRIECLYHGWQFAANGQCLHIPQLPKDTKIPTNACVQSYVVVEHQGIVWLWAGEGQAADAKSIPSLPELASPEFSIVNDFMTERNYDQTYVIENLFDPAHVPSVHQNTDGKQQNPQPLEIELFKTSIEGIEGRYQDTNNPKATWINLDFLAPNTVIFRVCDSPKPGSRLIVVLYSIPLGKGRSPVLLRICSNIPTWQAPRWFSHFYRSRVVEEDMPIAIGQQTQVERLGRSLKELYLPLKTSDLYAVEYRKWLDQFGSSLPFYQGYTSSKLTISPSEPAFKGRFYHHTRICSSCNRAYQNTILGKQILVGTAIALAALAIITVNSGIYPVFVAASLLAVALAFLVQKLKTKFELG